MLQWIRLVDFKSFADQEVELAPLTLLVGANAAGKSNFLDALWFLHGLADGDLDVSEVLDGAEPTYRNGETWPGLRGGSKEASRLGKSQFEIRTRWRGLRLVPHGSEIPHEIVCRSRPRPAVVRESCGTGESQKRQEEASSISLLKSLSSKSGNAVLAVSSTLSLFHWVAVRPERMRDYGQLGRSHLAADGTNFSGALHHLCSQTEEKQTLVDWLTELLAPEITDIDFIEQEELGDVMAMFVEEDGTRISARSLSDGTLRFLGLLLHLRRAAPGSTFLIEEIDSGLHPARLHVLMDFLGQVTRARDLQIFATTHAPACLDAVDEETRRNAVVLARVPEHEGTVMRRLADLPHFEDVVRCKGFSELFTTGWLEMAL